MRQSDNISQLDEIKADSDSFTLASFTTEDAFELGNLLYARLYPYAIQGKPTVILKSSSRLSRVLEQLPITSNGSVARETLSSDSVPALGSCTTR
jgi:hypothetical protein